MELRSFFTLAIIAFFALLLNYDLKTGVVHRAFLVQKKDEK